MINLWLNIRFGCRHIQWEYGKWLPTIFFNKFHIGYTYGRFAVYSFKWPWRR